LGEAAGSNGAGILMVGFNRRYAPLAQRLRDELCGRGPLLIHYRVNAGRLPRSHWVHDPKAGGGRIVGELCHFVDFVTFLADGVADVRSAVTVEDSSEPREDTLAATLSFGDGSVATIAYSALGDVAMSKERVEIMGEAGSAVLDDFRELRLMRGGEESVVRSARDKGHTPEIERFLDACRTGRPAQSVEEIVGVMAATFAVRDHVRGVKLPQRAG
jgi:predicted dehydrogenase